MKTITKFLTAAIVALTGAFSAGAQAQFPSAQAAFNGMFNARTGISEVSQWRVQKEMVKKYPRIDFSDYNAVFDAYINNRVAIDLHCFTFDPEADWVYSDQLREFKWPKKVGFMGVEGKYLVAWRNDRPARFTYDPDSDKELEEVGFGYENPPHTGFEWFAITYDSRGLPLGFEGKLLPEFGGDFYTEVYSDYKLNAEGLWTQRTVLQRIGMGSNPVSSTATEYRHYNRQ